MIFTSTPLRRMRLVQGYGVNYGPTKDFYTKIGLVAHNGWDLSLEKGSGTECFAVAPGIVQREGSFADKGYGLAARLTVDIGERSKIQVIYGHLQKVVKEGEVKMGEQIGECDNSGYSTGPHLHLGIRYVTYSSGGAGPFIQEYNNGYLGYVDPAQFFPDNVFSLPVDNEYGNKKAPSVAEFAPDYLYFLKTLLRVPTKREYNALRFGYWDIRTVLDPAMFTIWTELTKPEAIKRGIIKKV